MARPDYLFLIGVGRSGTNAVRHSLGLQPSIYYNGHENNVVPDLLETALINCTQPDREVGMTIPQADYDRIFERVVNDLLWHQHSARRIGHSSCILAKRPSTGVMLNT